MFENLSNRLSTVFDRLTKQGALSESDISAALREVRLALIEADVSLPIVRNLIKSVGEKAEGQAVTNSVTPGQQVVKIVHDELVQILSGDSSEKVSLKIDNPPAPIMMVGLQGSGKTTSTAKVANWLSNKNGKKILMASLDTSRPAAMEQLALLGKEIGIDTLPIIKDQEPISIAKRARQQALLGGYDVFILDTAGRLHVDQGLMDEVAAVKNVVEPKEILLVVDSLTGQDAVNVASEFTKNLEVSGVILTRMDGDGRGGAALSMRAVTGMPIRFVGVGEKLDALEEFHPERVAGRILGMGDVVALVEKAQETIEADQAAKMAKRFQKGHFNMNDLKSQLEQMIKMGGMQSLLSMMPGMGKMSQKMETAGFDDRNIRRQIAIIDSMTKKERIHPGLLQASRKKRISLGSGTEVSELNRLIKMHRQMSDMMKKLGRTGNKGMLKGLMGQFMGKGPGALQSPPPINTGTSQTNFGSFSGINLPGNLSGLGKKSR